MELYDLIIIGAGPSGLLAAGRAAEKGAKVLVLEKMERAGRKLLITGKGRCNITNNDEIPDFIKHIHPTGNFLRNAFSNFFSADILRLLKQYGVESVLERGGRYFPASNKSSDVLNALLTWNHKEGTEIRTGYRVEKLLTKDGNIIGVKANGVTFTSRNVVLAAGGRSYPATGSNGEGFDLARECGHTIEKTRPALVPLETRGETARKLQGLTLKNIRASLWINDKKSSELFGEMIFTHFGISGPVILSLSRKVVDALAAGDKTEIVLDLKPALDEQKLDNRLQRDLNENGRKKISNMFKAWLPSALIPVFIDLAGLDAGKECHQVTSKERKAIRQLMKNFVFIITKPRSFKEAVVTAGGISQREVNPKTMESKIIHGLYFAGEIMDVDADTGGYNLQIAFSTGWLAGNSSVHSGDKNES